MNSIRNPTAIETVMSEELHQIGDVAKRLGLSLRTVRYYEEAGLVRPSKRTNGGFRLYGEDEIARLDLIKQMQPLGFSLKETRKLLQVRDQLERANPGDPAYARAHERLSAFAVAAKGKCEELRRKLDAAERFASELQADLRRRKRQPATPKS